MLYRFYFDFYGLLWVLTKSVVEILASRKGQFCCTQREALRKMIWSHVVWCIWSQRSNQNLVDSETVVKPQILCSTRKTTHVQEKMNS